jgi:ribosomal protein L29
MKTKEFEILRQKTVQELAQMLKKLKAEVLKTKIEVDRGRIKNVHAYLNKRKEIAKILTLISEKSQK